MQAARVRPAPRRCDISLTPVVPPLCLSCREPLAVKDAICPACWRAIDFIRPPLCDRLSIPLPFDPGGLTISAAAAADPPDYDRARARPI